MVPIIYSHWPYMFGYCQHNMCNVQSGLNLHEQLYTIFALFHFHVWKIPLKKTRHYVTLYKGIPLRLTEDTLSPASDLCSSCKTIFQPFPLSLLLLSHFMHMIFINYAYLAVALDCVHYYMFDSLLSLFNTVCSCSHSCRMEKTVDTGCMKSLGRT